MEILRVDIEIFSIMNISDASEESIAMIADALELGMNDPEKDAMRERIEYNPVATLSGEDLRQAIRPVNSGLLRARREKAIGKPVKIWDPKEKIMCEVCHVMHTRANRSSHRKSERHKHYEKIQKNLLKLLWNDEGPVVPPPTPIIDSVDIEDNTEDNIDS